MKSSSAQAEKVQAKFLTNASKILDVYVIALAASIIANKKYFWLVDKKTLEKWRLENVSFLWGEKCIHTERQQQFNFFSAKLEKSQGAIIYFFDGKFPSIHT